MDELTMRDAALATMQRVLDQAKSQVEIKEPVNPDVILYQSKTLGQPDSIKAAIDAKEEARRKKRRKLNREAQRRHREKLKAKREVIA